MGKKIKLREAQLRAAEEAICARLRARSRAEPRPGFIESYAELAPFHRAKIETYRHFALRAPEHWRCRLRVRAPEKRFLDLVRLTFAHYPVAFHLEQVWTDELHAEPPADRLPAGANAIAFAAPDFYQWYMIAAQGRSLHREVAHHYLSRRETHHFLNAPDAVTSTPRAFWYAVVIAAGEDAEIALRVARTKIAAFPVTWMFWKEVARYFARNPTSVLEMNDLIDFFQATEGHAGFSPHGRSLPALRRRMEEWHRSLSGRDIACGGRWHGSELPDSEYVTSCEHGPAVWRFRQIRTGDELFREGQRMHHCVVSYKWRCENGLVSIWSLTCEYPAGKRNRGITIEVASDGTIVQCRGFANREPYPNELAVVQIWANEHGLAYSS